MAHVNETKIHTGPTMHIEAADFTCERTGSTLKVQGTFTLRLTRSSSKSQFQFNYAIRGKYNGGQSDEVKINPNFPKGTTGKTKQNYTVDFEFDAQAAGTLQLFGCCYGTSTDSGCTVDDLYSENPFYSEDFPSAMDKASIVLDDWSEITKHDSSSAWFTWNEVSNQSSRTSQKINGSDSGSSNTGDSSGRRDFKPSDFSVGQASSYTIEVKRENDIPSSATDSATVYTYTTPTLDNITYPNPSSPKHTNNDNTVNADRSLTIKWGGNKPVNDGKTSSRASGGKSKTTSDRHKIVTTVNGTKVLDVTTSGNNTSESITINSSKLMECVPYNSSYDGDGQSVTVKVVKSHNSDSSINVEKTRILKVRYTPVLSPAWPTATGETGYRLNNSSGTILQRNSVVEKSNSTKIYVYWNYPSSDDHQDGIVDGYRVIVKSGKNKTPKEYDVPVGRNTYTGNVTINSMDVKFGTENTIEIRAYYKDARGGKHYGPALTSAFPCAVTKLQPPTTIYPANNSNWINKNYRILLILPEDGDYEEYEDDIRDNYIYDGIEININGNITYSFSGNSNIFSLTSLSYMAKLAANPSLVNNYPTATSYTFKIRVKKRYGYNGMDLTVADPWSAWSSSITVKVVPDSFSVQRGEYIMASHYNTLFNLMDRIQKTYPLYTKTIKEVKPGDYIMASDFYLPYNDIKSCFDKVNGWGTYASSRNSVKFNNGNSLPNFVGEVGEYITALEEDTTVPGRDYIWKMHTIANMLK